MQVISRIWKYLTLGILKYFGSNYYTLTILNYFEITRLLWKVTRLLWKCSITLEVIRWLWNCLNEYISIQIILGILSYFGCTWLLWKCLSSPQTQSCLKTRIISQQSLQVNPIKLILEPTTFWTRLTHWAIRETQLSLCLSRLWPRVKGQLTSTTSLRGRGLPPQCPVNTESHCTLWAVRCPVDCDPPCLTPHTQHVSFFFFSAVLASRNSCEKDI